MAELQQPEGGCSCVRGADGTCGACLGRIGTLVKDLAGLIMEGQRRMEERITGTAGLCAPCARRDWDLALATTVSRLAAEAAGAADRRQRVGSIVGAALRLVEAGKQQGVAAYPLTERALTEMAAALVAAQPG